MEVKIEAGLLSYFISPLAVGSTQVYKQKVKHLLYEHQNNITTLKADGELALKLQQDEFRVNEGGLGKDKRNLKQELKEQELANQDTVRSLKLEHSKEITKLLSSSNRVLKVSKGVASWKKYVDYFSDVIVDGLSTAIIATVRYLLNQLDPEVLARTEGAPLMEIQLELVASEIVWKPELTEGKVATR